MDGLVGNGIGTRFTVSGIGFSQRMTVENFSAMYEAGDHESLKCSISLLEYKNHSARILAIPKAGTATPAVAAGSRPDDKPQAKTYTVKSGDSFWRIAQQQLGNGSRYDEVATLNGMTAASVIHAGDVLKLPDE